METANAAQAPTAAMAAQTAAAAAQEAAETARPDKHHSKRCPDLYRGRSGPVWNNYNPAALVMSGDTTGTNAGIYAAIFTSKEGYKWRDGTTDPKSVPWSIGRTTITTVPSQNGSLNLALLSPNEYEATSTFRMTLYKFFLTCGTVL